MGNRAVIALEAMPTVGIYVHWNGGPESVLAFIEATKKRGARSPAGDPSYAFGRLAQTTGDYFCRFKDEGELLSFGVGSMDQLDQNNYDNGVYWIANDWSISRREYSRDRPVRQASGLKGDDREKFDGIVNLLLDVDRARQASFANSTE